MIAIFDWDGTLCDSLDHIVEAMQAAADERGLAIPEPAAVRDIVGLAMPEAALRLFPEAEPGDHRGLIEAYSRQYVAATTGPARLYEGARDMLEALRADGFELAIATGKSRRGLARVLAGLAMDDFFEATRCADETRSKPDPLMLSELLAERGKRHTEAVMIGDSEYDLDMAARLEMPRIGVSFGVHGRDRLASFGPAHIIDHLSELPPLLKASSTG